MLKVYLLLSLSAMMMMVVNGLNSDGQTLLSLSTHWRTSSSLVSTTWKIYNASDPCLWAGVACNSDNHRVVSLDLSGFQLSGELGPEISRLAQLKSLNLSFNRLAGSIPSQLSNCTLLRYLDLSHNAFSGPIPPLPKSLIYLDLSLNQFVGGRLPTELGECINLQQFAVVGSGLTGPIPSSFGNLTNMTLLYLSENQLSGNIPPELGNCSSLVDLQLDANQLEGTIPNELGLLNLTYLYLFSNRLTGEVPMSIWKSQTLEHLLIYENSLFGELPVELTYMKHLKQITLFTNHFSGIIPQTLGINATLTVLDFNNNSFTGPIPPYLCSRNQLEKLILGLNNLQGPIPPQLWKCRSLKRLILRGNTNLTGVFPDVVDNPNLSYLSLENNFFTGQIPASFGMLTNITEINLSMNRLSGVLPLEFGNLLGLQALNLSYNALEGPLPSQLANCKRLLNLDASHNLFNGSIPASLQTMSGLLTLDLSENHFTGSIPMFLSQFGSLIELRLGGNSLGGKIPSSIVELKALGILNLSHNCLTGNPGLCVDCVLNSCEAARDLRRCAHPSAKQKGLTKFQTAMVALGTSTFLFAFVIGIGLMLHCRRREKHDIEEIYDDKVDDDSLFYKVMEATDDLDDRYIIGRGAHGTVYKASLGRGDGVYAVKKLMFGGSKEGSTSMVREIETVGKVRHRNLVKLEDFWIKKDYGLILYKYMHNGSLHDILHEVHPPPLLDWSIRCNIALGTAHGLAYLHFDCHPAIVHRDIKPMNILLDSELEPHISDFGIAKLLDQSTPALMSGTLRGTVGYIAPENAFTSTKSMESDVYSYGVVLLELITRKKAVDPSFEDGLDIVRWVRSVWNEKVEIEVVVDPDLFDDLYDGFVREQVTEVLQLALKCTLTESSRRPTMRDVVKQLEDVHSSNSYRSKQLQLQLQLK
uniref:receptor-like protein kinase isoform X2 n=1 Tax=Erigeron canadensis TaxID=72917 RepID=UPI001CB8CFBE|nr:receptor-like protein kinase isoform X2 [Erigeron canadensis]